MNHLLLYSGGTEAYATFNHNIEYYCYYFCNEEKRHYKKKTEKMEGAIKQNELLEEGKTLF